jgi:hypothetical protein
MRGLELLYPNRVKIALAETMSRGEIDPWEHEQYLRVSRGG